MTLPLPPETLEAAEGLLFRARRLVEGVLGGLHRSPFEGANIEFSSYNLFTMRLRRFCKIKSSEQVFRITKVNKASVVLENGERVKFKNIVMAWTESF